MEKIGMISCDREKSSSKNFVMCEEVYTSFFNKYYPLFTNERHETIGKLCSPRYALHNNKVFSITYQELWR